MSLLMGELRHWEENFVTLKADQRKSCEENVMKKARMGIERKGFEYR